MTSSGWPNKVIYYVKTQPDKSVMYRCTGIFDLKDGKNITLSLYPILITVL